MKPNNIIIVRHGQSTGNANKKVYETTPDYALPLTNAGMDQGSGVGEKLANLIPYGRIQFYVSPFWRTRLTFLQIYKKLKESYKANSKKFDIIYYEDPRLREQEWGQNMESREGYKDKIEEYRDSYGHFYYRFRDGGESCADVFDRVSDFMGTMHRDFKKEYYPKNVIIVTHGMTMRLFIMRWFHCTVEEFESWGNPVNCGFFHLKLNENGKYDLLTPLRTHKLRHEFQFDWGEYSEQFGKTKVHIQ